LIKQNNKDAEIINAVEDEEELLDEKTASIIKKYKGKILKEFVPHFIPKQDQGELSIEYESFDECVDEYFSQAEKQKEVTKV